MLSVAVSMLILLLQVGHRSVLVVSCDLLLLTKKLEAVVVLACHLSRQDRCCEYQQQLMTKYQEGEVLDDMPQELHRILNWMQVG